METACISDLIHEINERIVVEEIFAVVPVSFAEEWRYNENVAARLGQLLAQASRRRPTWRREVCTAGPG